MKRRSSSSFLGTTAHLCTGGVLDGLTCAGNLLLLGAPFLSPSKVNLFDALVEHGADLLGEEVRGLTVLCDKATTTSGVNFVCCVGANFSLSNHLSESI